MRPFLIKLVSVLVFFSALNATFSTESTLSESRLIRKVFLDVLHVPPSPGELTWYLAYNTSSYETAVDWIVAQPKSVRFPSHNSSSLKDHLMSIEYKYAAPIKINQQILDTIIKFQSGNLDATNEEASRSLVSLSIVCGEGSVTETIDYMSLCLMARVTTVEEINNLVKIYNNYSVEQAGYLAVLNQMKTYNGYKFK